MGWTGLLLCAVVLTAPACAADDAPTAEQVEKVLKQGWDRVATTISPRAALKLNNVRFGKPHRATAQEVQVEGLPDKGQVTPAIVDFTVRTYYNSETHAMRYQRDARVFKDKMGDWSVVTGSPKGEDVRTIEPAQK